MEDLDERVLKTVRDARRQSHALKYWTEGLADEINATGGESETKQLLAKKLFEQLMERVT